MININSEKGITIVSLVITVIILLILSSTAIYNLNSSKGLGKYKKMIADIKLLNDKTLMYFNKYNQIPTTSRTINIDGTIYYEIDLSKLQGLTLNYGSDYGEKTDLNNSSDVYLINSNLSIYYLKGIEKSGQIYHKE